MTTEYPTEYKNIFCDKCEGIYTHVSPKGNNFRCLKCLFEDIEEIMDKETVY